MKKLIMIIVATIGIIQFTLNADAAKSILPKKAHNMSAYEVRQIYASHTWKWGTGGAYFGPKAKFYAVSGEGKSLNIASGRWLVTKGGRLCFKADWSSSSSTFKNVMSCFNHAEYKGNYYQAKGLSGQWYSIKSAKPSHQDMIDLIVSGDQVSCLYLDAGKRLKHHLSANQASQLAKLNKSKVTCPVGKQPIAT